MTTGTQIRLLLVEDDPSAASLVREALRDSRGPAFDITHVTRLRTALDTLALGGVDLVLSDLGLPDATGLEACERLLEAHPGVPLVVLTGIEDEATGIEAVRRGAQDFLLKSRLDPEILARSLDYAVERHAMLARLEEAVREARAGEVRLRRLIERSAEGSVVLDASRTIRFVNPAAEALLGHPARALLGSGFALPLGNGWPREVQVPHADGTSRPAEMRVTDLEWEGGNASLVSLYDLSDRKRAERVAVAQDVQRAFLPESACLRTGVLDMSGMNELCEDASGDYYDFVPLDDGRIAVPIGDVTGHGLGPAILMAQARASLRAFCRTVRDLPTLMGRLNDALAADMSEGRFMTLFLAVVEPRTGAVSWCNAGHVPALLHRARTGAVERLEATGLVLGVVPGAPYAAGQTLVLEPGDTILLCSDGATEAEGPTGEQFGDERLAEVLGSAARSVPRDVLEAVRSSLRTWMAGRPLHDDLTLVAIRRVAGVEAGDPSAANGARHGAEAHEGNAPAPESPGRTVRRRRRLRRTVAEPAPIEASGPSGPGAAGR